jgi:hypothetical protein
MADDLSGMYIEFRHDLEKHFGPELAAVSIGRCARCFPEELPQARVIRIGGRLRRWIAAASIANATSALPKWLARERREARAR